MPGLRTAVSRPGGGDKRPVAYGNLDRVAMGVRRRRIRTPATGSVSAGSMRLHVPPYVDDPVNASMSFERFGVRGQVQSYVRPLDAAYHSPRARMEMRCISFDLI